MFMDALFFSCVFAINVTVFDMNYLFCLVSEQLMPRVYFIRLWKFPPLRLVSMVMLSATLLGLTSSMGKSLKILFHLPTTVMYELLLVYMLPCI